MRRVRVGKCINNLVAGIQTRMELERNKGGYYIVGEVMESIVGTIVGGEIKKTEELRRSRL